MVHIEKSFISGRNFKPLIMKDVKGYEALTQMGIGMDAATVHSIMDAMDGITPTVTTAGTGTPEQFLQAWLPGFVKIQTAARKIDELVGIQTIGDWEDEEIVQGVLETSGTAAVYGDYTNIPFSSWNANFERRSIVRFEEGMRVGSLELQRAAKMRVDPAASKREGASLALEIARNNVGFFGFNGGTNRTYGILNDPALSAYVPVATGIGGYLWSQKTWVEITADIRTAVAALIAQSNGLIDPMTSDLTLVLPVSYTSYLSVTNDLGSVSVQDWINKTFKNMRVVGVPQFLAASAGSNVFYLYADSVDDNSSDGGRTFVQAVPSKFQVLGVEKLAKGYQEDYSNATAGVLLKRPFAVVRYSGI